MRVSRTALRVGAALVAVGAFSVPVLVNTATATTLNVVTTTPSHDFHGHKIIFPMRGSTESSSVSGTRSVNAAGVQVSSQALIYQGGAPDGIGVTTGQPQVYVVFWGSQWGSATQSGSYAVPFVDTLGVALRLEQMYSGFGTNSDLWSGVMTQYCQGVPAGTTACSAAATHVAYPSANGALSGVWVDTSA